MDTVFQIVLTTHIVAGFTSLALFFIPAFAKKGSKLHNTVGRWYVFGMWTVVVSALLLCAARLYQGHFVQALFLGFLALLTSGPLFYGIAVLRNKREPSAKMKRIQLALETTLAIGGIYLAGAGLGWWGPGGHTLLLIFGILGMAITISGLVDKYRGKQKEYDWLVEHLSGMLVTAIAAFTAFFAFGGRNIFGNLFGGNLEIIAWVTPTILGVTFIRYYKWKLKKKKKNATSKAIITLLLITSTFGTLSAQLYVEKQSRYRFAQLNFGADVHSSIGGNAVFTGPSGPHPVSLGTTGAPRLILGGTHFWGHADFQVAFPLITSGFQNGGKDITIYTGVETAFKYYPWRIEQGKIRPYIGFSIAPLVYEQKDEDIPFGQGPEQEYNTIPLKTGLTFNHKSHLLELGLTWNYANQQDYPISRTDIAEITLPPVFLSLSYRYFLDTTVSGEEDWENGNFDKTTEKLAAKGQLNNFFLGIAPSSAWWNGKSSYNEQERPYINKFSTTVMPDLTAGYYLHHPDLNLAINHRSMVTSAKAYGTEQALNRRSIGFEVTKAFGDFHGFVPFAGPILSREHLEFTETFEGEVTQQNTQNKWAAGLTFGWDIRPNRLQVFTLRTNLRWYPKLHLDLADDQQISFGALEFNFIQLIIYPERLF
ncbi:hypothetical protein [Neolewinella persica]|uniref:hypothetical protein n=1 Tax=Neolewinella persica TaxID=70998 RepID=UPI00037C76F1|nr:hypothetical protein [Neolewinella persica]